MRQNFPKVAARTKHASPVGMNNNPAWTTNVTRAKTLEARLEVIVQKYSSTAQKINADFLCDEENALLENRDEQELAAAIEQDLAELSECIAGMSHASTTSQHESLIKRYHEIHFDYGTEFKNISATIHRKRESMELFKSSKNSHGGEEDSNVAKLLRERNSIAASLKSINDVISQAFETRSALTSQRNTLTNSGGGLTGLSAAVPTFNSLIDGIQKKKVNESIIVAIVVAILLCFVIWWTFLR